MKEVGDPWPGSGTRMQCCEDSKVAHSLYGNSKGRFYIVIGSSKPFTTKKLSCWENPYIYYILSKTFRGFPI